ncbi:putative reverse transcriptase domain-containing protein [Tanacetum coccineum]
MKCQPLNFKGTEGVVEMTQWVKKMETVFRISNCSVENQIKFSTCTLLRNALTWWNSRVRTIESDKIKRYVGGLPDMIHESVVASKPNTMQETTKIVTELMDKRIWTGEKKPYGGSKSLCAKCNYHHDGSCAPKCHKCNRVGHLSRDSRSPVNTNASNNQRGTWAGQKPTCYECENQGHYKSDYPELKNRNYENQAEGTEAHGMVYALGGGEIDQNPNNIEDEIET